MKTPETPTTTPTTTPTNPPAASFLRDRAKGALVTGTGLKAGRAANEWPNK